MSEEEKTYRINVRGEGDESPGETPAQPAPAPVEPAAATEPGPGEANPDDPVVISVEGSGPEAEEPPVVLAPVEETVERAKYLELLREHCRGEEELKKLQGQLYEEKVRFQQSEERVAERQAQLQRVQAEFQNFRRRVEKEREEAARYAHADLLADLLPVLDNLDRAARTPPRPETLEDFHKGLLLIFKQLQDVLGRHELRPLSAAGSPFDPNLHEAVTRVPSPTVPADHVVEDLQKGYLYKDRLLRPALVAVSSGAPEAAGEEPPATPGDASPDTPSGEAGGATSTEEA